MFSVGARMEHLPPSGSAFLEAAQRGDQQRSLVGIRLLPWCFDIRAAKVTVSGQRRVDEAAKFQVADQRGGTKVKGSANRLAQHTVGHDARAEGVHVHT